MEDFGVHDAIESAEGGIEGAERDHEDAGQVRGNTQHLAQEDACALDEVGNGPDGERELRDGREHACGLALRTRTEPELHPLGDGHHVGTAVPLAHEDHHESQNEDHTSPDFDEEALHTHGVHKRGDDHGAAHVEVRRHAGCAKRPPRKVLVAQEEAFRAARSLMLQVDPDSDENQQIPDDDEVIDEDHLSRVMRLVNVSPPTVSRYRYTPEARFDASNSTECAPAGITSFTSTATSRPSMS